MNNLFQYVNYFQDNTHMYITLSCELKDKDIKICIRDKKVHVQLDGFQQSNEFPLKSIIIKGRNTTTKFEHLTVTCDESCAIAINNISIQKLILTSTSIFLTECNIGNFQLIDCNIIDLKDTTILGLNINTKNRKLPYLKLEESSIKHFTNKRLYIRRLLINKSWIIHSTNLIIGELRQFIERPYINQPKVKTYTSDVRFKDSGITSVHLLVRQSKVMCKIENIEFVEAIFNYLLQCEI